MEYVPINSGNFAYSVDDASSGGRPILQRGLQNHSQKPSIINGKFSDVGTGGVSQDAKHKFVQLLL